MTVSPADGVPSAAEVVRAFRQALTATSTAATRPPDALMALLLDLHANNVTQWNCEDAARIPDSDDAIIATAKREIDRLNATRHRLVEAIDAAIEGAITQDTSAPPCTETPAMVYDRLSVLAMRIHVTERAAEQDTAGDYALRLPTLHGQLAVLEEALDALFDDLRSGRKRFVPYQSLKLYRPPAAPS